MNLAKPTKNCIHFACTLVINYILALLGWTWIWTLFESNLTQFDPFFDPELGCVWPHNLDLIPRQHFLSQKCFHFLISNFFFSGMRMAAATHIYFLSKFLEFLDTFFFIARKKFSHVSRLQLIHHGVMPFFSFLLVRWLPNGNFIFYFSHLLKIVSLNQII